VKRILDLAGASIGLALTAPLMIAISAALWVAQGRPILFRQLRTGRDAKPFSIIKFRTMIDSQEESERPLPDELRITPLGGWLRKTSLDELPELINVVSGRMALVGPRPMPIEYLGRYTGEEMRRHQVRPGITGWAQVNGRNKVGWDERFRMDVWYVDHQTTLLDLKILIRTVLMVWRQEGIAADGHGTMAPLRPHLAVQTKKDNEQNLPVPARCPAPRTNAGQCCP
jgi:lipopolysaccharide/colanic/teichoic acid biosynthesis glycosyltransferase